MTLSPNDLIDLAKNYEVALPPFPKNGRVEAGPLAQRIDLARAAHQRKLGAD